MSYTQKSQHMSERVFPDSLGYSFNIFCPGSHYLKNAISNDVVTEYVSANGTCFIFCIGIIPENLVNVGLTDSAFIEFSVVGKKVKYILSNKFYNIYVYIHIYVSLYL